MSGFRFIRLWEERDVARLTLTRPPLNILTVAMMQEIGDALDRLAARPDLKALVLEAHEKAFCAGVAVEDHRGDRVKPMLDSFHGLFRRLRGLDCITVAAVAGAALGGGAELATFCDVVIATERATFGQPEIKLGVFPPIAALHYPVRVGAVRALSLLVSGEVLSAAEAARIGLVDQVVAPDQLSAVVEAHLERVRATSGVVLRLTKRAVRDALGVPFEQALASLETLYHDALMNTEDAHEGLRAFAEKRPPVWRNR